MNNYDAGVLAQKEEQLVVTDDPGDMARPLPFIRFRMGELELTIVSDGYQVMKPVHPIFAPYHTSSRAVKQQLQMHFRSAARVELGLHILLIRKENRLIMIDSGLGTEEATAGLLPEALASAGFSTTDITDIVITHAHLDHIGGLLTKTGALVFPAARVYLSRTEYDFWMADEPGFANSPLNNHSAILSGLVPGVKRILLAVQPQLLLVDDAYTLFDCIDIIPAPGHTPGHSVVRIFSGKESLLHIADLIHSDVLQLPHPEWGVLFDVDFALAVDTRKYFLEQLAANGSRALAYHLPWPGLGYVRCKGEGYKWIPEAYATPNG